MLSMFFDKAQEMELKKPKKTTGLEEYKKHEYKKISK